ncbi:MAG: S41 family peptidase, partial [Bacteroidota bacterium]
IMENEAAVRETIVARASCRIRQRVEPNQGLTAYVSEKFLEALAQQQDPHTMYFSPSLKNAFEQSLSTEGLSFGFEIDEDEDGTVEIAALSPGGPAWKSNEINIGDKVVGIETESGPGIDLFCTTIWELRRYLSTEAPERITLLLRKSNGQEQQVPLIKEKVDVEENVITSFVLDGSRRVGYIYLPGFYTHWEGHNALGCANDLAKELLKLRLEGIEGLILDLRNNGGGSMQEALGLAGIFIDEGTLVLERQQEEDVRQLKDQNRGTAYDDPVIVMVNGMSASASEIVAAILQDYHRALIVGDTTYGKSTGQIIMPINAFKSDGGYLKTTVSQYYRVGGGSHQQLGVVPDILLPERLEPLMPSEADDLTAIPADTVQKEVRFTALKPLPREALVLKSATRIAASSYFQEILEARAALQQYMAAEQVYDLRPSAFITQNPGARAAVDTSARDEMHETFAVKNTRFSETWVALDEQRSKLNADERKQILGDMYIEEAFRIMLDLIAYQTP